MIFPKFIKKGDTVGITAVSDGYNKETETDIRRLEQGILNMQNRGFQVVETNNVRTSSKGRSSDGKERAKQLGELFDRTDVTWIIAARGGDYLFEMLPYVGWDSIKKNPKWVQGYSDPTGILYTITTNCDIATIYANNFSDFGMELWHPALEKNVEILKGKETIQHSFDQYEEEFPKRITGVEGYSLKKEVRWITLDTKKVTIKGRLLGGCLDVLINLVGTSFDKTTEFIEKYQKDGILWYLESFTLSAERLTAALWQLKEAGWFRYASGFIFGRPAFFSSGTGESYEEAVKNGIGDIGMPIILEADIGHRPPQMTMINGATAEITSENGIGSMSLEI